MKRQVIFIIAIATVGLANAGQLYGQYVESLRSASPIVCVVGSGCQAVVMSLYGSTLGIKNELFGIFYYGMLVAIGLCVLFLPKLLTKGLLWLVRIASVTAMLFSLYLLYIQVFILKTLCFRCLVAILLNVLLLILVLSLQANPINKKD